MTEFNAFPEIIVTPYSDFYIDLIASARRVFKLNALHLYDAICYIETVG
jgi:hypothetical protein